MLGNIFDGREYRGGTESLEPDRAVSKACSSARSCNHFIRELLSAKGKPDEFVSARRSLCVRVGAQRYKEIGYVKVNGTYI